MLVLLLCIAVGAGKDLKTGKAILNAAWYAESNQPYADYPLFGSRIATGDFNGDGYLDVAIGAYNYTHDQYREGAVFVWYGTSTGLNVNGDPSNCDWMAESNQEYSGFGYDIAVGDFNGDGYDDLAVGAYKYDRSYEDAGAVFVWYGGAYGLGVNGNPTNCDFADYSGQEDAYYGGALAVGNFNGDEYDDLAVGAYLYDYYGTDDGKVEVFYGSSSGLTSPDWYAYSKQTKAYFGSALGTGDFNGDGYYDIAIAAYRFSRGQADEGVVFVWYGSSSGLNGGIYGDTTNFDWIAEANQPSAYMGSAFGVSAGDFNGDGYDDIAIGAPDFDRGQTNEGAVFVWYGSLSGLNGGVNGDTTNFDWIAESNQSYACMGECISTGDFNGDGYDDIAIGASYYDNPQTSEGAIFVWYGSGTGINNGIYGNPSNCNWKAESDQNYAHLYQCATGNFNGDNYDEILTGAIYFSRGEKDEGAVFMWEGSPTGLNNGVNGDTTNYSWIAESNEAYSDYKTWFGYSIAYGDFNNDGYTDIAVGAPWYSHGESYEGAVFVWYGTEEGFENRETGNPLNCDWMAESNQSEARMGYALTVNDFNGDGYDDIAVSAPRYSRGESDEGVVFVWYGSAIGLNEGINGDTTNFDWIAESNQPGGWWAIPYFGCELSSGDYNGDGYSDIAVGAKYFSNGETYEGIAFVWYGSNNGLNNGVNGDTTNYNWKAELNQADAYVGNAIASGDFNNDGYDDIAIGAYCYDNGQSDEGMIFIWYGNENGLNNGTNGDGTNANWMAEANLDDACFGYSIASGDFNGDGYYDIAISAAEYSNPESQEGAVFVWYSSATGFGLQGNPSNCDWKAEPDQSEAFYYAKVTTGDLNGDGYDDIIIGAYDYDNGEEDEGGIFVWYGSASGLGEDGNLFNYDWHVESNQENAYLGYSVCAGDVNADGGADILSGAVQYTNDDYLEGAVFLWLSEVPLIPDIWISDTSHNFGEELCAGDTILWRFYIKNKGNGDLSIDSIISSNPVFGVYAPIFKLILSPGDSVSVAVYCAAQDTGSYEGTLTIYSNDPYKPAVDIKLYAKVIAIAEKLPEKFELKVKPNPILYSAKIHYSVPAKTHVKISIIDITGRCINKIVDKDVQPGYYTETWKLKDKNGNNISPGIYFVIMESSEFRLIHKAIIMR